MNSYPKDFEHKISFDTLRAMLQERCLSSIGRDYCRRMRMLTDKGTIIPLLSQTDEMMRLMDAGDEPPLDYVFDPTEAVLVLRREGAHLDAGQFAALARMIDTEVAIQRYFCADEGDRLSRAPYLFKRFKALPILSEVADIINRVVTPPGEVRDSASPELAAVRREKKSALAAISSVMRSVINRAIAAGTLSPDVAPAVRDGRPVIPVTAALKKSIPGIIHDRSATGKTLFIEPSEVVEANNNLREIEMREQKEILVVLTRLTSMVAPFADDILFAAREVGYLDFIKAKARLAKDLDAQMPNISSRPGLEWYHAVHPILLVSLRKSGREVVPLDIRLDDEQRILVISGPNAGGKSVCLKTIAIVQYMTQCGLLPTLYSNSHVGVFKNILLDIGDEQSIENDLSTYSSHLRNMKAFIDNTSRSTLFLADEMGSGTEPQIGGSIAQAILADLNEKKAYGVVTTHYQNLKTFAAHTPGLVNGAMLYDRQNLCPLFTLTIGTPGSSFALDIARKSGIPIPVLDMAKDIVGSEYVDSDKYLLDLARDKKYWAQKRLAIKEKERKIDALIETLNNKADEIKQKRAEIIHEARNEARQLLSTANSRMENAIREIRLADAEKERTRAVRSEIEEYKKSLESNNKNVSKKSLADKVLKIPGRRKSSIVAPVSHQVKNAKDVLPQVGDFVRVKGSDAVGEVLSIKNQEAEIAMGQLRSRIALKKLEVTKPPKKTTPTPSSLSNETISASRRRQLDFKNEIDLRGFRADQALQAVTYFLDDAIQFGATRLRILHGTGTGALRIAIRKMLQHNPAVVSFHDEDVRLGGAGITVVDIE